MPDFLYPPYFPSPPDENGGGGGGGGDTGSTTTTYSLPSNVVAVDSTDLNNLFSVVLEAGSYAINLTLRYFSSDGGLIVDGQFSGTSVSTGCSTQIFDGTTREDLDFPASGLDTNLVPYNDINGNGGILFSQIRMSTDTGGTLLIRAGQSSSSPNPTTFYATPQSDLVVKKFTA